MGQQLDSRFTGRIGHNVLVNGAFQVNQEAVSGTVTLTVGEYGHDMWRGGSAGCTYTFSTTENVTTITITAGTLEQEVEGTLLQSGDYVLSWSGTAQAQIASGGYGDSGEVTSTAVGGTNVTVEIGTGTIYDVQLEEGSTATDFERLPISLVELLCYRYYWRATATETYTILCQTYAVSASSAAGSFTLPIEMRAIPTVGYSGAFRLLHPAGSDTGVVITAYGYQSYKVVTVAVSNITVTSGTSGALTSNNDVAAYIEFDARL